MKTQVSDAFLGFLMHADNKIYELLNRPPLHYPIQNKIQISQTLLTLDSNSISKLSGIFVPKSKSVIDSIKSIERK